MTSQNKISTGALQRCLYRHDHSVKAIRKIVDRVEYRAGGILPSEMFTFLLLCYTQGVKHVVESGRSLGFSTECIGLYAEEFGANAYSIEMYPKSDVDERLASVVPLVHLCRGKASPWLIDYTLCKVGNPFALLLDGPKGTDALALFHRVKSDTVFGAVHDVSKRCEGRGGSFTNDARPIFECGGAWFTDDPKWIKEVGAMDERVWKPTSHNSRESFTAVGFTLAFLPGEQYGKAV